MYLDTAKEVYKQAAKSPQKGLCCTTSPVWQLPGLKIPEIMMEMNYGCGSTVNPGDLVNNPTVLYVGVGGGMELLQFAYFNRKEQGVIGIDVVDEMLETCQNNINKARRLNTWLKPDYIVLKKGDALHLPVEDASVDIAAQNCLFNVFKQDALQKAFSEMYRVLKPQGRLMLSDPVCEDEIPDSLREDPKLRALCLSGALPLKAYIQCITDAGFGTVEVRAKRAYRILSPMHYDTEKLIFIESVEVCAIKDPMPEDGPCVFTGKTAIYYGKQAYFDDGNGHILMQNQPAAICDKTAAKLSGLQRDDICITPSTWFYQGGGCC